MFSYAPVDQRVPIDHPIRKRIEQGFDWIETPGGLRKLPMVGLAAVRGWVPCRCEVEDRHLIVQDASASACHLSLAWK